MKHVILIILYSTLVFCSCKHETKTLEVNQVINDTIKVDSIQDFDPKEVDLGTRYKINEKEEDINKGEYDHPIKFSLEEEYKDGNRYVPYLVEYDIINKTSFQASDTKIKYYVYYLMDYEKNSRTVTMKENYRSPIFILNYVNDNNEHDYYSKDERLINQEDIIPDEEVID